MTSPVASPDQGCRQETGLVGQARCQEFDQAGNQCGSQPCPILDGRDYQGDEGERQDEIQRPTGRDLRADEDTDDSADLPGTPQSQPGAEEIPMPVRPELGSRL